MVTSMTLMVPERINPFGPPDRYRSRLVVVIEGVEHTVQVITSPETHHHYQNLPDYREFLTRQLRREMMKYLEGVIFK